MKTVGSNIEVAMAFCAPEPQEMRSATGNLRSVVYDDHAYLYTYGAKLAIRRMDIALSGPFIERDVIYVNPRQYSVTSTQHRSTLWNALHWKDPYVRRRGSHHSEWGTTRNWQHVPSLDREFTCDSAWRIGREGEPVMTWPAWVPVDMIELAREEVEQ